MIFIQKFIAFLSVLLFSLQLTQAGPVQRQEQDLQPRDDVAACQLVLLALKASSFCSSFIGLRDATKAITATGPSQTGLTTVPAAPCTVTAPGNTATSTTTATIPGQTVTSTVSLPAIADTITVTAPTSTVTITMTSVAEVISTQSTTTTTVVVRTVTLVLDKRHQETAGQTGHELLARATSKNQATTAGSCTIKGLPPKVTPFACNIVSKACSRIVQPKTITLTTTVPGGTKLSTTTASPKCASTTAPNTVVYATTTTGAPATTVTKTITPSLAAVTATVTPAAVTLNDITTMTSSRIVTSTFVTSRVVTVTLILAK